MFKNENGNNMTPIINIGVLGSNALWMKREDFIPFSFGGNKARKAKLFFEEIDLGNYDCVVTYGGSHSNHCRVVANMAARRKMPCYLVEPKEVSDPTFNRSLMDLFDAQIITVPVEEVHETLENLLENLKLHGMTPYFIPGGGHGNIGTQAYVDCYEEIKTFEYQDNIKFDYIFLASGTGTTQAGLVCGQIINQDKRHIVGISIARKSPYGRDIIVESVKSYLTQIDDKTADKYVEFIDCYTGQGYGKENDEIIRTIKNVILQYGIPLDSTYTGKAFYGMNNYLKDNRIENKNILFIHTGGTPLFFDDIRKLKG